RGGTVVGSNDGRRGPALARARVFRFTGSVSSPIELAARDRFLRLTVFNGDDAPLRGIRLKAVADPRTVLVEGGNVASLRVLYGNPSAAPPSYDFARLPADQLGLARARPGSLGPEALNEDFRAAPDTRSFSAKHPAVITMALVLAALVVVAGGLLAVRMRS